MLEKFNPRERNFIIIGVIIGIALLGFFAGRKVVAKRAQIAEDVVRAERDVQKMANIVGVIKALPQPVDIPAPDTIAAQASNLAKQHNLKVNELRPRSEKGNRNFEIVKVDVNLSSVPMRTLLNFIYDIDYGNRIQGVRIGHLRFRRTLQGKEEYDVSLSLVAQKPKTGGTKRSADTKE